MKLQATCKRETAEFSIEVDTFTYKQERKEILRGSFGPNGEFLR
jgi:hypothetical protein